MRLKNLNPLERQTTLLLLFAALFNGVVQSLNQTQDIIARKALHAADWQLMLMTMIWPVANFFSIWWGRLFERSSHKSRYFLITGIIGRLTLVYAVWLTTMSEYLVLLALLFASNSLLVPAQNSIYQRNIDPHRRARVFGITLSLSMLVSILVTFAAGRLLDIREQSFRWILVATGICGFISSALLANVRIQHTIREKICGQGSWKEALLEPITGAFRLLKEDKAFAAFERSFSLYGMGFIMMQPIIPIYLVDKLQLSYTNNFLAKGILSQMGLLLLAPMLGKLHDRTHPFRFISVFFGLLVVFPLLFVVSSLWQGQSLMPVLLVFLAYLIFGIAMAGVNISWSMGSIFFAGERDASIYQSLHVTLTGVRGLIAPVLGYAMLKIFSITAVFVVAAVFFLVASLVSYRDYRKVRKELRTVPAIGRDEDKLEASA